MELRVARRRREGALWEVFCLLRWGYLRGHRGGVRCARRPLLRHLESASSLLEKSLLGQEEGAGREPRLVMLETIREYAREARGERGGRGDQAGSCQYFLTLAEEAYPELNGPDQIEWLARLEAEHDNMRAALSWALERNEAEVALRLGAHCGCSGRCGIITARADAGWKRRWQWMGEDLQRCGRWHWPG